MKLIPCDHCLLPYPEKDAIHEEIDGTAHRFCCEGCAGVFRLIHAEHLDGFYAKREWSATDRPDFLKRDTIDTRPFLERLATMPDGTEEVTLYIEGIRCASCVWLNEKFLTKAEGVISARVNYATHQAKVQFDPARITLEEVLTRILSIGYLPKPYSESERFKSQRGEMRDLLVRFGTASFLSMQIMLFSIGLYAGFFQGIDESVRRLLQVAAFLMTTPVVLYAGMPFIRSALSSLKHFHFTMDTLIATGSLAAYIYSTVMMFQGGEVYFDTAGMIITLILLGRLIEAAAKTRASQTLERLANLAPKEARKVVQGERSIVQITDVAAGDMLEVLPGERVPVDGVVTAGETEIDESLLTGESRPVAKQPESEVIGGSINQYGTFLMQVTRTGEATVLSGIIQAVADAQTKKPAIQRVADRIVGVFVPLIILLAIGTTVYYLTHGSSFHHALMTGIAVIIIACPCSLGLATPLAVLMASVTATSKGVLLKGGDAIERGAKVKTVLFDKTGTLTAGELSVTAVHPVHPYTEHTLLQMAASLEARSEHAIAKAIVNATESFVPAESFTAIPGRGGAGVVDGKQVHIGNRALMTEVTGLPAELAEAAAKREERGETVVFVAIDGEPAGWIATSDTLRPDAEAAVAELKRDGVEVHIASGDNSRTTTAIAHDVGVEHIHAELTPAGKKDLVTEIQKNRLVAMVGDGINDAPPLTAASVGIAMGKGTDIAIESADVVLTRSNPLLVPFYLKLSRLTYTVIRQNIFWSLLYNVLAIPLAMAGILHPIVAAGAMAASSLFVVTNSLRIRRCGR